MGPQPAIQAPAPIITFVACRTSRIVVWFPMFSSVTGSPVSSRLSPFASEKLRVAVFGKVIGRPERGVAIVSVPIVRVTCTIERAGAAPYTRLTSIVVVTSDPPVLPTYRKSITGAARSGNGTSKGPWGPARMTCTPPTYVRAALLKSPTSSRYTFHVFEGPGEGRWTSMRSPESGSPFPFPSTNRSVPLDEVPAEREGIRSATSNPKNGPPIAPDISRYSRLARVWKRAAESTGPPRGSSGVDPWTGRALRRTTGRMSGPDPYRLSVRIG